MGAVTQISWCDHTFNPWEGCTKVSAGCAHCYAEARNSRFAGGGAAPNWGKGAPRRRTSISNWNEPRKWNKALHGFRFGGTAPARDAMDYSWRPHRARVFCASLADWLDPEVPIEWLADLLKLFHACPNLDWLLLSKLPELWRSRMLGVLSHFARVGGGDTAQWLIDWQDGKPPANVWIGTSVENQACADERIPRLVEIPAAIRFLSVEPLLGPLALTLTGIQWVIVGGESGKGSRSCEVEHIRSVGQQCLSAGVPVFVKQLGAHPIDNGKRLLLTDSKGGGDMSDWPNDLRVRQFPPL